MNTAKRYVALDGLRGLLAITVVVHHYAQLYHSSWMGKAWVSVDAFFILSGFVIFHSYAIKIQSGMGFWMFAKLRILRLYPMYFFGLCIGLLGVLIEMNGLKLRLGEVFSAFVFGIFVLPYFNNLEWPAAELQYMGGVFPLNFPAWSLFFELLVNGLFFFWLMKIKKMNSILICLLCFPVYLWISQIYGIHSGWATGNFWAGIPRVVLYFFLGCFIYQIHLKIPIQSIGKPIFLIIISIILFSFRSNVFTYFLLFACFPLTILLASRVSIVDLPKVENFLTWLGNLSYPLYITHYSLARFSYPVLRRAGFADEINIIIATFFALVVSILLARTEPFFRAKLTFMMNPLKQA